MLRVPLDGCCETERVVRRKAAEGDSEHTIAQGIVRSAQERGLDVPRAQSFEAIPGKARRGALAAGSFTSVARRCWPPAHSNYLLPCGRRRIGLRIGAKLRFTSLTNGHCLRCSRWRTWYVRNRKKRYALSTTAALKC